MTKQQCPQCGRIGQLQIRGNSHSILHYGGLVNGRHSYVRHTIAGIKPVVLKELELSSDCENKWWTEPDLNWRPFDYQPLIGLLLPNGLKIRVLRNITKG